MNERAALRMLADTLAYAGDDAAVVDGLVISTDMLHETTDFPAGTTRYTAGWRGVAVSLSDLAAMGASPIATVAIYGAPDFDEADLGAFVDGAREVSATVGANYVGGDLDGHDEFTVATTAVGQTDEPVWRSGASPGEAVCVTGTLGRTAAALRLFDRGAIDDGNALFQFDPRVAAGRAIAPDATAMMDSSDGLARSLHQLGEASNCGFAIDAGTLPIHDTVYTVAADDDEATELAIFTGEDFELVVTVPTDAVDRVRSASPTPVTVIGEVTEGRIELDGEALPDRGYTHD